MSYSYECHKCKKAAPADQRGPEYDEIIMDDAGKNSWIFRCWECATQEELLLILINRGEA